jgi:DNA topoisomerase I
VDLSVLVLRVALPSYNGENTPMASWIRRKGSKSGGFRYVGPKGRAVSRQVRERIDALRIPPAWTDVHIAASATAPIQAWGYDARGRKQYRYHVKAIRRGELKKYYRVRQMARELPTLRRRIDADFRRRSLTRERVCAGLLKLIGDGFFRVGSERYVRENSTFGITTLTKSHAHVDGDIVTFDFVGKRGIRHRKVVVGRAIARFVKALGETPGTRLFRFQRQGEWYDVSAEDVNDYLKEIADFPYTAKDFRTWGGTLRAATVLAELGPARTPTEAKRNVVTTIRLVASELGNTPAICRKSYVHPALIEEYMRSGATISWRSTQSSEGSLPAHAPEERALIDFLDEHFPERRKQRRMEDE